MNRIEANIAGTRIPLKVSEEEEIVVRKAIDEINTHIKQYQSEFPQKDIQDCILMALLTYAVDYHKAQPRIIDETSLYALMDIRSKLQVLETQSQE